MRAQMADHRTLRSLGHHAEALKAEAEAVATYRRLALIEPDRYRPALVQSLTNLGVSYSSRLRHRCPRPQTRGRCYSP